MARFVKLFYSDTDTGEHSVFNVNITDNVDLRRHFYKFKS